MTSDQPPAHRGSLSPDLVAASLETIDRELAEIGMLAGQVKTEAARHEQRRAQAAERVAAATANPALPAVKDLADAFGSLVALTRRAVLMEAQAELLEAKGKALLRHRGDLERLASLAAGAGPDGAAGRAPGPAESVAAGPTAPADRLLPPSMSRVVLAAQEDLRRDIARSMHDGPAQSLTNIVLQTQIVERLMDRDPAAARGEVRLLAQMVQATLDTTKNFIFDVRPMVLDDLGLVPTLRRSCRERGRRAHVTVEFESHGQDRRLAMDLESTLFRMLDVVLAAYLAQSPDRVSLVLDWSPEELGAIVTASRAPAYPAGEALPPIPEGDLPDAMRRMIQDRHDDHAAALVAAEDAARLPLPAAVRRDIAERASAAGLSAEVLEEGEVRISAPLSEADGPARP